MSRLPPARWWSVRPAANRKPTTYRCPICGRHLPALTAHMLIAPEGDSSRRRHAHTECVLAARRRGELTLEEEWRRAQRGQRAQRSQRAGETAASRLAALVRGVFSSRRGGRTQAPRE